MQKHNTEGAPKDANLVTEELLGDFAKELAKFGIMTNEDIIKKGILRGELRADERAEIIAKLSKTEDGVEFLREAIDTLSKEERVALYVNAGTQMQNALQMKFFKAMLASQKEIITETEALEIAQAVIDKMHYIDRFQDRILQEAPKKKYMGFIQNIWSGFQKEEVVEEIPQEIKESKLKHEITEQQVMHEKDINPAEDRPLIHRRPRRALVTVHDSQIKQQRNQSVLERLEKAKKVSVKKKPKENIMSGTVSDIKDTMKQFWDWM